MKTFKTNLGFEYDLEVMSVTRDSIDYIVTCEEGEIEFIDEAYDNVFATEEDIRWFNSGDYEKDALIDDIQQFDQIEKAVNEMVLAARN